MPPAPFMRDIAALGVAYWEDVTHGDESMLHATMVARKEVVGLSRSGDSKTTVIKTNTHAKGYIT